jgi:hypothetical protein
MWQFEYEIKLENRVEVLKFDSQAPERDVVWKKADELGEVQSIRWRVIIDGKIFKEGEFERVLKLQTLAEAIEYLEKSWKTEQKTVS